MMFIHSSKTYAVKRADGTLYRIPRGFVGEIPADVAKAKIVELAIKDGSISTPASKKDADIDKTAEEAKETAKKQQKKKEA